jgi:hypothetical protein
VNELTLQELVHLVSYLKQELERRALMVRPVILSHAVAKVLSFIISSSFRGIDNPIFIFVLLLQEFGYLKYS